MRPEKGEGRPAERPATHSTIYPASRITRGSRDTYAHPLQLKARGLPVVCWWLKAQPWADAHLRRIVEAWERAA